MNVQMYVISDAAGDTNTEWVVMGTSPEDAKGKLRAHLEAEERANLAIHGRYYYGSGPLPSERAEYEGVEEVGPVYPVPMFGYSW